MEHKIMSEPEPANEPEVIHRLKNHMCIIVGFCDLLVAEFPADDRRRADLMEIYKAARDAMAMMDELSARIR
jgi:hypothetical protein